MADILSSRDQSRYVSDDAACSGAFYRLPSISLYPISALATKAGYPCSLVRTGD
jgi:hypothetical protein